ncbi:hypothetical protein E2C01_078111 [Portunus trituberculatus]|uniref:Uncharacterized protein n=1 Tax=Portunus trituberculatus TaxID=210409 RepID=A0A5B7IHV9_PORTR|nr:hypothetical protein [Portunus trituberculatus]
MAMARPRFQSQASPCAVVPRPQHRRQTVLGLSPCSLPPPTLPHSLRCPRSQSSSLPAGAHSSG